MKKGFTLIELLAVIVILAIIAVIAVPIVIDIIEDAKDASAKRSIDNYVRASELLYTSKNMTGRMESDRYSTKELLELGIHIKGEIPNSDGDNIIYDKGEIVSYNLTLNNKRYILANEKEYIISNGEEIELEINEEETTYEEDGITIYKTKDWEYIELENGKIQLTKYTGNDTTLIVPSKVNGKDVYSIGSNKSISVVDSVGISIEGTNATNILGDNNYDASSATVISNSEATFSSIIFSKGIEVIGDFSFYAIKNLKNLIFSSSIVYLGHFAFFENDFRYVEIPEQIMYLGQNVFQNNYNLKKVIYNAIKAEVNYKFQDRVYPLFVNASLEEIEIGEKVETLPTSLFHDLYGTFKYEEVTIPESVNYLGRNIFMNNYNLKKVYYNARNVETGYIDKTDNAIYNVFYGVPLKEVVIGENVESISDYLFWNQKSEIEELTIPENIKHIGQYAFAQNYRLKKVNFNAIELAEAGTKVSGIAPIFYDCSLEEINIGPKVKIISKGLFYDYSSINKFTSVAIPNSVKTIGESAFFQNSNLNTITMSNSVTNIGKNAFKTTGLATINYKGTNTEFLNIKEIANTNTGNEAFVNASIIYK